MSMVNTYYVVAGYDMAQYETYGYRNWCYSDDGEKYTDSQKPGNIQLFNDHCSGYHLIFGYVVAAGDEFDCKDYEMSIEDILVKKSNVDKELNKLIKQGVFSGVCIDKEKFKIYAFCEAR